MRIRCVVIDKNTFPQKYYVADALNSQTGKVIYPTGLSKDTELFIQLLERLETALLSGDVGIIAIVKYFLEHVSPFATPARNK